jgi:predicted metal-binding membrane protein
MVTFVMLAAMWLVMMALMMAPTAWPWVRAFDRLTPREAGMSRRVGSIIAFSSGYMTAWAVYAAAAALIQAGLIRLAAFDPIHGLEPRLASGVLLTAGLFQFAPLKRACLEHCRNPLSYFLRRWRNGPVGGYRMGLGHGLFCVGCCWALMATCLAVGAMSVWWMAALTAAVFAEQVVPHGEWLRAPLGLGLIAAGLLRA